MPCVESCWGLQGSLAGASLSGAAVAGRYLFGAPVGSCRGVQGTAARAPPWGNGGRTPLCRVYATLGARVRLLRANTASSPGARTLSLLVRHGLVEYICPARRAGVWTVYPRSAPWRRISVEVGQAVADRGEQDYQWELHLEWWEPASDQGTELQSQPLSPEPTLATSPLT